MLFICGDKLCCKKYASCGPLNNPPQDNWRPWQNGPGSEVLIGADAVALYPSLTIEIVTPLIYRAILETKITFLDLNLLELTKYIALNLTAEETKNHQLALILPTRRHKNGTRPTMRREGVLGADKKEGDQLDPGVPVLLVGLP